jgi:hypothetical protein
MAQSRDAIESCLISTTEVTSLIRFSKNVGASAPSPPDLGTWVA